MNKDEQGRRRGGGGGGGGGQNSGILSERTFWMSPYMKSSVLPTLFLGKTFLS